MRAILTAVVCCLVLAGCNAATTSGSSGGAAAPVSQVQKLTANICAFVPTATTVLNIFAAGSSAVSTVGGIANAICNAVTTRPLAEGPGDRRPRVGNVVVRGRFIR